MNHHAYLYEGSQESLKTLAEHARALFTFKKSNDPDVYVEQVEKFGIEDAQRLKERALLKTFSGRSLFVIGISSITTEAQQALLKLFEEPQEGVIFVLLLPHGMLIPTLHSRFLPYPQEIEKASRSSPQIKKFLASSYKERSAMIGELLEEDEGVKERTRKFLQGLEAALYIKFPKDKEVREGLEDIAKVRSYVADRSPSLKMLMEHLAATLPAL